MKQSKEMCPSNNLVALVVEDRPEVALIWRRHLELLKFEIRVAATLADAKRLAKEIPPPDLILLDLRLTDSRDAETLASIKELTAGNPECAVIVLSGYITPDINKLAVEQGAHAVIEKLSINRAADLWAHMKKIFATRSTSVQSRLACTTELIEKLSNKLSLL